MVNTRSILFATALVFTGHAALACECMDMSGTRILEISGLAFTGVASPLGADKDGGVMTAFTIKDLWKGPAETSVVIHHHEAGPACGVAFEAGETYTIFATRGDDGNWHTNSCMYAGFGAYLEDYKSEADTLDAPLHQNPQDETALLAKGKFLLEHGDNENALGIFNYLRSIAPGNAEALIGRARAFLALGSRKEAAADVNAALMLAPENAEALELKEQIPEE